MVLDGGVGGEGVRFAGEAVELGSMKSSMFISSTLSKSGGCWLASRSLAIPEGALVDCCLFLGEVRVNHA